MARTSLQGKVKNLISSVLAITLMSSSLSLIISPKTASATSFSGDGSISNPYKIVDCEQLQSVASGNLGAYYELSNDIDCTGVETINDGKGFSPIGDNTSPFTGHFDGKGFAINNMTMQRADEIYGEDVNNDQSYVGIFGKTQNAVLKNVTLNGAMVKGYRYVGGLVGYANNSTLTNIHVNDNVADNTCNPGTCIWARWGENGGGVVGKMVNGTLTNSTSGGNVKGSGQYIGGLVGYADSVTISNSISTANVDGGYVIGGVIGQADNSTISFVHSSGSVEVKEEDHKSGNMGGGVIGLMSRSTLSNSYATGSVTAYGVAGGLVGNAINSTVETSHSSGMVTAYDKTGGLIGNVYGLNAEVPRTAIVRDSYATGAVLGQINAGGLIGYLEASQGNYIIQRTYATGSVSDTYGGGYHFGGLIGSMNTGSTNENLAASGILEDSYATGSVTASYFTGGLIGYLWTYNDDSNGVAETTIRRTYSTGNVSGTYIFGGLIGYSATNENERLVVNLSDNFTVSEVIPVSEAEFWAGFLGSNGGNVPVFTNNFYNAGASEFNTNCSSIGVGSGCSGVTDVSQFKDTTTNNPFKNSGATIWDFDNVWKTQTNDYPVLRTIVALGESSNVNTYSAENGSKITIEQTGCSIIDNTNTSKESSLSIQDPAYSYPLGFVGFRLTGCPDGATAIVKVTYTGKYDVNSVVARKYNASNNSFAIVNNASITTASLDNQDATEIIYPITDGGSLDQDGLVNGSIVDPVGLAQQVAGVPNTGIGSAQ